jgi:hypothetical protein
MHRIAVLVIVAGAVVLGLNAAAPMSLGAQGGTPSPLATPETDGLCINDEGDNWQTVDVQPPGQYTSSVLPVTTALTPGVRLLYLVVITLPPDQCMPYSALGNQKDGAIVMLVQQGTITFQWEPLETGIEGENPAVERGDATGLAPAPPGGQAGEVPERTLQTLVPGDWITQNQEVRFSYRNAGSDNAVILKAVWAEDIPGGCGGGCR